MSEIIQEWIREGIRLIGTALIPYLGYRAFIKRTEINRELKERELALQEEELKLRKEEFEHKKELERKEENK